MFYYTYHYHLYTYTLFTGEYASINEKGAATVMTVELELFNGSMISLLGKSENNAIDMR